jgi:chemotaxis signal transduction protein
VSNDRTDSSLICRVHKSVGASPLRHVMETMRLRLTGVVTGAPQFVCDLAVIRGTPVPLVVAAKLLVEEDALVRRWVTMAITSRRVALAVEGLLGVRPVRPSRSHALPPLLSDVGRDFVLRLGLLDEALLPLLQGGYLSSDEVWARLDSAGNFA